MKYIKTIVNLIKSAQKVATKHGFTNLLQPGLVKELIIGDILGHEVHKTKHAADAWDPQDPKKMYEYLTCVEPGSFQIDRMFKSPANKKKKSLERIKRCDKFYCAVFHKDDPLVVKEILELEIPEVLKKANEKLKGSDNSISHISLPIKWARSKGKRVYPPENSKLGKKLDLELNAKKSKKAKAK